MLKHILKISCAKKFDDREARMNWACKETTSTRVCCTCSAANAARCIITPKKKKNTWEDPQKCQRDQRTKPESCLCPSVKEAEKHKNAVSKLQRIFQNKTVLYLCPFPYRRERILYQQHSISIASAILVVACCRYILKATKCIIFLIYSCYETVFDSLSQRKTCWFVIFSFHAPFITAIWSLNCGCN